jgi:hypothetical protein
MGKKEKWSTNIIKCYTLNKLIKIYGLPKFCKIDVEGYELNVIRGLSSKIPFISFEFHFKKRDELIEILKRLDSLGKTRYNVNLGQNYIFEFKEWVESKVLIEFIDKHISKGIMGDIFVSIK